MEIIESEEKLPKWAFSFVSIGESLANFIEYNKNRRLTVALCLPRLDFAAVFIGLGILKKPLPKKALESGEDKMRKLLGTWVWFKPKKSKPIVGILEHCETKNEYKIREYSRLPDLDSMDAEDFKNLKPGGVVASWTVLMPQNFAEVRPAGRDYNPTRRVGTNQIGKLISHNQSASELSRILGSELEQLQFQQPHSIFNIIGNKARIDSELSQSLLNDKKVCLAEVLRPAGRKDYEDSHLCEVFSTRSKLSDGVSGAALIENSRVLPDQLSVTRNLNRIILLARNSSTYEECVASVMNEYALSKGDASDFKLSERMPSIISRAFFQK